MQARESYKKLVVSHRPIPELEHIISQNYELENHSVNITELSTSDLAEKNNWIGFNKVIIIVNIRYAAVGLDGLRVTCSPRDPRFVGSNPAVVNGFFQDVKILSTNHLGGTLSHGS